MSAPGRHEPREEGYWPGPAPAAVMREVVSGNELVPQGTVGETPDGPGVCILNRVFSTVKQRVLTLGIQAGNAQAGRGFPTAVFNGPVFASTSCGLVDGAGLALDLGAGHPYLACMLEYGVGAASQKCWIDWYQGSYNLPPCEFVRVSAIPWGKWWAGFPQACFNAVASVGEGDLQGAHPPTVTAVGSVVGGATRSFSTPANARAVEVLLVDPASAATLVVSGAAAGVRSMQVGLNSPGWSPLDLDLGVSAVAVTSDMDAVIRVQFWLQL